MDWKRIFLRAAGVGVGFALCLAIVVSVVLWRVSRPQPPKPWDTKTIEAEYDGTVDQHTSDIEFRYALKNTGTEDYRISDSSSVQLAMRMKKDGELTPFNKIVRIDTPIFVPAGHKTMVFLTMKTGEHFQHQLPEHPTDAEREQYRKAVLDYLSDSKLGGFALFDEMHRIEIDFPTGDGWEKPQ
jgi:hypothetical protein